MASQSPPAPAVGVAGAEALRDAHVTGHSDINTASNGDLWPCAWSIFSPVIAACGDGSGFDLDGEWSDIVINAIHGTPQSGITGERLAAGDEVAPIWVDPTEYNRKPTGMVAVSDPAGTRAETLYLAVQNLRAHWMPEAFDDAPVCGIVTSTDGGRTWRAPEVPQFSDHVFTTVMFADLGQSNRLAGVAPGTEVGFVYAYGLDGNWRTSHSGRVPSPTGLFLARVPSDVVEERSGWEFFTGLDRAGRPQWDSDIRAKHAVLRDDRRLFRDRTFTHPHGASPVAQGGVVFHPGLGAYLYTSWAEYSFEFYRSDAPWGPWELFLQQDFGEFPWRGPGTDSPWHGGYATTMPSKFLGPDGSGWVQSNWFVTPATDDGDTYNFSLRRFLPSR